MGNMVARRHLTACPSVGFMIALIALCGDAMATDSAPTAERFEMCYKAEFEAHANPVHSITVQFSPNTSGPFYSEGYEAAGSMLLEYTEWGIPNVSFGFEKSCGVDSSGDFRCGFEGPCGAGTVFVHFRSDQSIIVYTGNATIASRGRKSLLIGGESFSTISGLYKLNGTPLRQSLCSPDKEITEIRTGRGDVDEEVLQIETLLSKLGFFQGIPDRVFDGTTAEATKKFQISRGLEATGIVDSNTYVFLVAVASNPPC